MSASPNEYMALKEKCPKAPCNCLLLSLKPKTVFFFFSVSALVSEKRRAVSGYMLAAEGYKYQIASSLGKSSGVHPELRDYPVLFIE